MRKLLVIGMLGVFMVGVAGCRVEAEAERDRDRRTTTTTTRTERETVVDPVTGERRVTVEERRN